jgi:hypothetical protein
MGKTETEPNGAATKQSFDRIDVKRLADVPPIVRRRFEELTRQWKSDCLFTSSTTEIAMHPAYQRIIGLGPVVVPLILHDLSQGPHQWFWALSAVTDATPVAQADKGQVRRMADEWLQWGKQNGYE